MTKKILKFALLAFLIADIAAIFLLAYITLQSMKAADSSDQEIVDVLKRQGNSQSDEQ